MRPAHAIWISIPLALLLLVLAVFDAKSNDGFYLQLGIGKNDVFDTNEWVGRESMGCSAGGGYVFAWPDWEIDAGFVHYSQCTRGNGFDNRYEDALDSIYISGRYYF